MNSRSSSESSGPVSEDTHLENYPHLKGGLTDRASVPVEALRQVAFFKDFSEEALSSIAAITNEKAFPAHSMIFREGDSGDALYIIKTGQVAIQKRSRHDTDVVLATYGTGEVIGDMSLIDDQPRSASLLTLVPTTCYIIEGSHFQFFLYSHREVTRSTLSLLTQRLRRANERMLISALDDHPDMVILTNDQFQITEINKQAQLLLHINPHQPIDSGILGKLKVLLGKLRSQAPNFVPLPWILMKPERLYLWVHVNPLKNDQGSIFGYLIELRDVTQDRAKSRRSLEIASFIIHRLPGLVDGLRQVPLPTESPQGGEDKRDSFVQEIHRQVDKLVAFTDLEAGPLRIDRDDIKPEGIIEKMVIRYRPKAERKKQTIDLHAGYGTGEIAGDRDRLEKLMAILIDNAITYTDSGLSITISTFKATTGKFGCRIQNPFVGTLNADDCSRFFDIGRQLDEFEQMALPDYGLDLPLAKHIVEAHHGTILIEPDLPQLFSIVFEI